MISTKELSICAEIQRLMTVYGYLTKVTLWVSRGLGIQIAY